MTAPEAAVYLRLAEGRDIGDALVSLEYLVSEGRIRPCRVGRHNRFTRAELDRFIHEQTQRYPAKEPGTSNRSRARRVSLTPEGPHDHEG